ncbi:SufS family cysteine desulfurase [Ignavigranum ruoffiae]|uniref:SufS family cysteine desulfurase n=1 Tax=Ignavigranum ruoffiae TaxID=89093 RepID=UPI00205158A5|nr:SufS family cysteine desulfurase [Ignavigranum ruoffiae]UPQ85983.1 SufS family cysteine desulfurase [Ignavigranum ruoffiae]
MKLNQVRKDFPILDQHVNQVPLIYFDNAATTQKPQSVIQAVVDYYQRDNANIHRGVHTLAQRATDLYEQGRQKVADFIGAQAEEIIFNRGTTEGLNFLIRNLIEPVVNSGDRILTTKLEHHSALVPLQALCERRQAQIEFLPLQTDNWQVDLNALNKLDPQGIKAIVIQQMSNVLGVVQPIKDLAGWAKQYGILVIVDGAQAVPHLPVNVKDLAVDGYCWGAHKMYGPTGIGACYLAKEHHETTPPLFYGGEMIHHVGDYHSDFKESPWKYEAGTMPIAQVVGFAAAIDYINQVSYPAIQQSQANLGQTLYQGMRAIDGIELYQNAEQAQQGIVSFNLQGIHPHDVATAYDLEGIAVRAGHHCCQPLMRELNCQATVRASLGLYNTPAEVDRFLAVTEKVRDFFAWA